MRQDAFDVRRSTFDVDASSAPSPLVLTKGAVDQGRNAALHGSSTSHSGTVRTACPYCGVGCGIIVKKDARGALSLAGDPDHPTNRGALCSKGRTLLHAVADRSTRLLAPELRCGRGMPRQVVAWEAAIRHVGDAFTRLRQEHGPGSIGFYVSGQCLTEEYYLANKLAKGFLRTNHIDTNSRLCMSSAVAGYKATLGADSVPTCYEDLDVTDTFLLCGANAAWCHPIAFRRIEARKAADPERVRLICVDPRRTPTAAVSDLHLQLKPGTDVALYLALAHELDARGWIDHAYVAAHCSGWSELRARFAAWSPERAAAYCGLAIDDIRTAAAWLGGNRRFVSLWTMGLNQSACGTDNNVALINLSLITGKIGKPGCGPFSLTGQPNAMGGREVGGLANLLPAHRNLADPAHRAAVARFWGVADDAIQAESGLTAVDMFAAARAGKIKALWIIATNPVASLPAAWGVDEALRRCELVVVQDAFANDTTPFADVLLPAATWLEKTGAMTNSERRIHLVEKLVEPPGAARPDWIIIRDVAKACGFSAAFDYSDAGQVFAEHAALTAGTDCTIAGLTHARIRAERSVQWPWREGASTTRLYVDGRFATGDGTAHLRAPEVTDRSEACDAAFPLMLTTGRLRDQWHTMTRTGLVRKLAADAEQPFVELNPADAQARGISDGGMVEVTGRRGTVRVVARVTEDLRPGVTFLPMHWGPRRGGELGRINTLTSDILDPVSKQPDLKHAAVQVRSFRPAPRRILVLGAGAAALALTEELQRFGLDDRITILGEENLPFYNRVLLPHLIGGQSAWADLVSADAPTLASRRAHLVSGARVARIARSQQEVIDTQGVHYAYDVLVLAMGSRAAMPYQGALPARGVHTLRRRGDAEAIMAQAQPGTQAVVVGAGLLGLELADALQARGCAVTVLQRSSQVMGRQLDAIAAGHVADLLSERGMELRFNAAVERLDGDETVRQIHLADGSILPADLVVFATGTVPNAELARSAGLSCGKGVTVDRHLRTSDERIFALGEVAETDGQGAATSAACRIQARHLAEFLRGNPHQPCPPLVNANLLKVRDLALASVGIVEPEPGDEVVVFHDAARRCYQKRVVRNDRLIGAICLGDLDGFQGLVELVASGVELDDKRGQLLRPGAASTPVAGKLVCSCHQVGEDTIRTAAAACANDIAQVCARTRAGTGCGSCRPEIIRLLKK